MRLSGKTVLYTALAAGFGSIVVLAALGKESAPDASGTAGTNVPRAESVSAFTPRPAPVPALAAANPEELLAEPDNATVNLSKKIAGELLRRNPDGPSLLNDLQTITVNSPDSLVEEIFSQELTTIDAAEFSPAARPDNLSVVADTPEAMDLFTEQFRAAFIALVNAPAITGRPAPSELAPLAQLAANTAANLAAIPVPERLAPLLVNAIRFVKTYANIYGAIAGGEADPFRALVALQAWQLHKKELDDLYRTEIVSFLKQSDANERTRHP